VSRASRDEYMRNLFNYHVRLVRLCRALAAIHADGDLFKKYAPKSLHAEKDNMQIRWKLEDMIRKLLREHGDFPAPRRAEKGKVGR
jgi:hypothetical protein